MLHVDALDDAHDTLMSVATGALHAAVVRGVYSEPECAAITSRLEAGALQEYAQIRDVADGGRDQITTLGIPVSPSDLYPAGPDVAAYHAASGEFAAKAAELFEPAAPFPARASEVLTALGGVPTVLAQGAEGQPYGEVTVRLFPAGTGLPPHCENHYMHIAVYDALRERVQLDRKIGFFVPLRLPPAGGRFVTYEEAYAPNTYAFDGLPLEIVEGRGHCEVQAGPGDMIVVGSGHRYHQVTRVEGGDRWTVGGFGALAKDGQSFVRWA